MWMRGICAQQANFGRYVCGAVEADMQESWRVTNEMLGKLTGEEEGAKKGPTDWRGWLNKQAKMRQADADADEQLRPAAF